MDRSIPDQQNVSDLDLGVVLLHADDNTYETLAPLMDEANAKLLDVSPGTVVIVPAT